MKTYRGTTVDTVVAKMNKKNNERHNKEMQSRIFEYKWNLKQI